MNFRKMKLRKKVIMILRLNQKNNSNSNAKKMMIIKKYLFLKKLRNHAIINITIKSKLRSGMRKQKKAALVLISTRTINNINMTNLIKIAKKYFKYR